MAKPERPPSGRTNLASCVVATIFLIFLLMVISIVYFTVFKPQDPKIAVSTIQLPSFSVANGTLIYYGKQVGFLFIPAGEIDAGRTQNMAATFNVQSFPLGLGLGPTNFADGVNRVGPSMEIESRISMAGRVRVLHLFSHHVVAKARCRVAVAVTDGSVLGFHC
ncbi:uncharacterized protein LOC133316439 isoform X2 [Gastrolobium bilobum]|uniref:uncharacterized protein LOC133316439 isoform X2 n=1 Tax=Gastrolobium bilobum TaxID=150636 RepID=UPI002AB0DC6F|nr:uncharacterized protein LOC133316439 isoform X2 [Gastrolobium bilobum]